MGCAGAKGGVPGLLRLIDVLQAFFILFKLCVKLDVVDGADHRSYILKVSLIL